jgi:hypothetical protein
MLVQDVSSSIEPSCPLISPIVDTSQNEPPAAAYVLEKQC